MMISPGRQRQCTVATATWVPLLLLALLVLPLDAAGDGEASPGLMGSSGLMGGTVAVAAKPKRLVYAGATPQASSAIESECHWGWDPWEGLSRA